LAQYRELAAFAQFASDLDESTRKQLDRGARVTELLKQKQYSPLSISLMAASLFAVNKGYLDDVEVKKVLSFEAGLHAYLKTKQADCCRRLKKPSNWTKTAKLRCRPPLLTSRNPAHFKLLRRFSAEGVRTHGSRQRDTWQDQERRKYEEDHQGDGNGRRIQNAQSAGSDARRPSLQ
jgi:hypothetical protein